MKVKEFFNRFYLHDSLMENIFIEESKVTFHIDLCWWMQKEYELIDEEMKRIKVVFGDSNDIKVISFRSENVDLYWQ